MQAVISSWLNLEKIIIKPENENYIRQEWSLVTFKIRRVLCPRNGNTLRKATWRISFSKQREWQRENKILFNNLSFRYFWSIFEVFLKHLERLKGSGRPWTATTPENKEAVEEMICSVENHPRIHVPPKDIAKGLKISQSSV